MGACKISLSLVVFFLACIAQSNENSIRGSHNGAIDGTQSCQEILNSMPQDNSSSETRPKPRRKTASNVESAPEKKNSNPGTSYSEAYRRILAQRGEESVRPWTLNDFFERDPAKNLAVVHPFTIANAAEKALAVLTYVPPRQSREPLYSAKSTLVYPMVTGHPLAGGRMVIGNEDSIDALVNFIASIARGDRSGKAFGLPGPAGTGKTELLYVIDNIQRNLGKTDQKFKQLSYRWQNLHSIPFLKNMFRFDRETGAPNYNWLDPDMPRSPFTLLRDDMKAAILEKAIPEVRQKWNMTMTNGWTKPEPKSKAIIKAILEFEFPELAQGLITENDLTPSEYLNAIQKYLVIVPKTLLQNKSEAQIIRAQTEDPNYEALFAKPNLLRQAFYSNGDFKDLAIDYNGQVFQQDGGLLMLDELYRNPAAFLNLLLEVKQNRMVQTDYGDPIELDVVPIWNSNDESIRLARENQALLASIDRDQPRAMRLLLDPEQIEATSLFQVEIKRFKMRALTDTALQPLNFNEVYPAPDKKGLTKTAYGRYALYYSIEGEDILIAPMTLNYMSWLAAASRYEVKSEKMKEFKSELNLVQRNPTLFTNALTRLKMVLGEREISGAERQELYRLSNLLKEGQSGISARQIETWLKNAINIAIREKRGVLTPRMIDQAFDAALVEGEIQVEPGETRSYWQNLRAEIKEQILLPKLERDVRRIISGDGDKANRVYDQIEREFIELAQNPSATRVTPDDQSEPVMINSTRLKKIQEAYAKLHGRAFSPNFLFRNLQGARNGAPVRDNELLEAVRTFLSDQDALTTDYISAFNAFYKGENSDPTMIEKVALLEDELAKYGYDVHSWREALAFTDQLRLSKANRQPQNPQQ